jgi:cell division protein FtsI/penicillin-binding protein 2
MTEALITVTQKDGTGRRAAIDGYDVAGKTGTAQLMLKVQKGVKKDGSPRYVFEYAKNQYLASFIGFAPAERPRFLLLVSAENPRKGAHSGSGVAAPVFRKIASRTLQYLQVPPNSVAGEKRSSENRNASLYRSSR